MHTPDPSFEVLGNTLSEDICITSIKGVSSIEDFCITPIHKNVGEKSKFNRNCYNTPEKKSYSISKQIKDEFREKETHICRQESAETIICRQKSAEYIELATGDESTDSSADFAETILKESPAKKIKVDNSILVSGSLSITNNKSYSYSDLENFQGLELSNEGSSNENVIIIPEENLDISTPRSPSTEDLLNKNILDVISGPAYKKEGKKKEVNNPMSKIFRTLDNYSDTDTKISISNDLDKSCKYTNNDRKSKVSYPPGLYISNSKITTSSNFFNRKYSLKFGYNGIKLKATYIGHPSNLIHDISKIVINNIFPELDLDIDKVLDNDCYKVLNTCNTYLMKPAYMKHAHVIRIHTDQSFMNKSLVQQDKDKLVFKDKTLEHSNHNVEIVSSASLKINKKNNCQNSYTGLIGFIRTYKTSKITLTLNILASSINNFYSVLDYILNKVLIEKDNSILDNKDYHISILCNDSNYSDIVLSFSIICSIILSYENQKIGIKLLLGNLLSSKHKLNSYVFNKLNILIVSNNLLEKEFNTWEEEILIYNYNNYLNILKDEYETYKFLKNKLGDLS